MARTPLVISGSDSVAATIAKILDFINAAVVEEPVLGSPAFTALPSIDLPSGLVGATFTGTDGTVTNGSVVSRRWLLRGAVIGTGITVVPAVAGMLVLENTAVGLGGTTVVTSAPVVVGTASSGSLGAVGMNLAPVNYYGLNHPFLDRMKTSRSWYTDDNIVGGPPLNADGYPIAYDTGQSNAATNVAHDGAGTGYVQRYVLESNKTDFLFDVGSATIISQAVVNGKLRAVIDTTGQTRNGENWFKLSLKNLATPFVAKRDYITCVRADQEAAFKAGEMFNSAFINQCKRSGVLRFMDWFDINHSPLIHWADRPQLSWASWDHGVPMEAAIRLLNDTGCDAHWNLPFLADDDFVTKTGQLVEATLNPNLRVMYEWANEVWNYGPGFNETHTQAQQAYSPAKANTANPAWGNQGYRSACKMALLRRAHGYSSRVRCMMMGQAGYDAVIEGNIAGAQQAIVEWSTPGNPIYDADFATRFSTFGALYDYIGSATYFDGGLGVPGLSNADKQTVQGWAAAIDDSGLAAAFRQMEFGDKLATPGGTLNSFPPVYARMRELAAQLQVGMLSYEGGPDFGSKANWPDGDPQQSIVTNFMIRLRADARWGTIFTKWLTLCRTTLGFSVVNKYYDIGGYDAGGGYGEMPSVYAASTPGWTAMGAFNTAPSAMLPLTVSVPAVETSNVGRGSTTTITTTGGVGKVTLTVIGLADGRRFDGDRSIVGKFTTEQSGTATVVAWDESGATATAIIAQNVGPPLAGYRLFRFTPGALRGGQEPGGTYYGPGATGLVPIGGGAAISQVGWVATSTMPNAYRAEVSALVDGDDSTVWNAGFGSTGTITLDAGEGNFLKPTSFRVGDFPPDNGLAIANMALVEASVDGGSWVQVAANTALAYTGGQAPIPVTYPG